MKLLDWFKRRPRQGEPPEEWWENQGRLAARMDQLELSWEETFGKVRRALASLAKRQQREESGDSPAGAGAGAPGNSHSRDPHSVGERLRAARARYGRS